VLQRLAFIKKGEEKKDLGVMASYTV